MPRIFDNIEQQLLPELQKILAVAERSDFCIGYFNLRGWKALDKYVNRWEGGDGHQCRLLIGMHRPPADELRDHLSGIKFEETLDNQSANRFKKRLAEDFRNQLMLGAPTNADEAGLRRLARQLKEKKVVVKLFLQHPLHAKLYLCFRADPINPVVGYVGSSNLTLAGLSHQGELNVDVMDHDATAKLAAWFDARWKDHWCVDISKELMQVIDESWARPNPVPPHHIYINMAYHLSREARSGLAEFRMPTEFGNTLFDFQVAAVKIAAHHMNKRGGVLIGDVVGLGKTLMASAVAKILQDDQGTETLIICPKNLVKMWQEYVDRYRLLAKVISVTSVERELPVLRRYRVVLIDESHNLRNREGMRYRAIQEYIAANDSRCMLLSATPYNKSYGDLSSQLRLFVPDELDLGIRPERLLAEIKEIEFIRRHQCPVRSLAAFEKSEYADDWRDLMRLYMVRRTRTFIKDNYGILDPDSKRKYLVFSDGSRSYFPDRVPKTVKIKMNEADANDQYGRLCAPGVVDRINGLNLPRYGLGNYITESPQTKPTAEEERIIGDLARAGKRLMGFCRTNLYKRLESSGQVFHLSVEWHIVRNFIFLHALENGLPLPLGTQDAGLLDSVNYDEDVDNPDLWAEQLNDDSSDTDLAAAVSPKPVGGRDLRKHATLIYKAYAKQYKARFKWLRADLFDVELAADLRADCDTLTGVLGESGPWVAERDEKLNALHKLLVRTHPAEKVIVFTQFADTVRYLEGQLAVRGVTSMCGVSGSVDDPTSYAWRFSPESNQKRASVAAGDELRVLISTDVLSEGQNLQDARIVVNFDLPWAIIRLIQRAGRLDRIGQTAEKILCYSFLPADGVEKLIGLRARVQARLLQNAEVVGTDEAFFENERVNKQVRGLYNEHAGILDDEEDNDVDLASHAYQIWKNAIDRDPALQSIIPALPAVVYSTRAHKAAARSPEGALVYLRTAQDNDALTWINKQGEVVSKSQFEILRAAECKPGTPALPRQEWHHSLVEQAVEVVGAAEKSVGGQLGRPAGARFRTYMRLQRHAANLAGTIFESPLLARAIDEIYRYPLRQYATDSLNRQLRAGIDDQGLANLVAELRNNDRLCVVQTEEIAGAPQIVCSMGLAGSAAN